MSNPPEDTAPKGSTKSITRLMEKAKYNLMDARNQRARCRSAYESDLPEPLPEGPEQKQADLARNILLMFPHTARLVHRIDTLKDNIAEAENTFASMMENGDATACIRAFEQMDRLESEKHNLETRLDTFRSGLSQRDKDICLSLLAKQREDRRARFKNLKENIKNHTREEKWWLEVLGTSAWLLRHGCTKAQLADATNPFKTALELAKLKKNRSGEFRKGEPLDKKLKRLAAWVSVAKTQSKALRPFSEKLAQEALEDANAFQKELNDLSCNPHLLLKPPFTPPKPPHP